MSDSTPTAPAHTEIERRWLVLRTTPMVNGIIGIEKMRQGYFHKKSPAIRIRLIDDSRHVVTFKKGGGMTRAEVNLEVSPEDGAAIMAMSENVVEKTRYTLKDHWELDVFEGPLEGLVILEIELGSEDEGIPWFPDDLRVLQEITGQGGWSNQALAFMSPDEQREFVKKAYEPPPG